MFAGSTENVTDAVELSPCPGDVRLDPLTFAEVDEVSEVGLARETDVFVTVEVELTTRAPDTVMLLGGGVDVAFGRPAEDDTPEEPPIPGPLLLPAMVVPMGDPEETDVPNTEEDEYSAEEVLPELS